MDVWKRGNATTAGPAGAAVRWRRVPVVRCCSDRVRYRPDSLTSPQRRRLKPFGIAPVEKSGPRLSKVMVWAQQDDRGSGAGELLDSVVVCIRDVDAPAPVGGNAEGFGELAVARAGAPPRGEEGAGPVELLDAVVATFCDVDVPTPVGRQAEGVEELAVARAGAPPHGEEGAARVELLDAVVATFCDIDAPAPVGRHAGGVVELAVARADPTSTGQEATHIVVSLDA